MTPEEAYYKCWENNKRDKNLEKIIMKHPEYAYFYAREVIKGRWKEAEQYIINDSEYAYLYAKAVIKGRWIEGENIIATNSGWAYLYALDIIKGKLPENMHNMMLLHADHYAKLYFKFIKNNPHQRLHFLGC
jgi:hypothetical protein